MFRSSLNRILDWAENALAPIEEDVEVGGDEIEPILVAAHPHRRELRWERKRRPGSIPHPPAHCISPVRRKAGARARQESPR
ncbi:MAG TPA: hypothetical protein VG294_11290 [Solirubrobacteraceae bacterium]|jgi:hypothetical protein|nr:hypothetical protein [Solirubrobacteraceae bacterium]